MIWCMQTKRLLLLLSLLLSTTFVIVDSSSAQIVRNEKGSSFKWVLVTDKATGEFGAETPDGTVLIPKGKYFIIFQELNGGFFELRSNGLVSAYSTDGKELISFSNGYDRIVKHKDYFNVRKNGLEGACDFNGNAIIKPLSFPDFG